MKKVLSLMLVFVFIFSFAGCGKDEKDKETGTVDIEYYAKSGQLPECNYTLGTDPEIVKNELSAIAEAEGEDADEIVYNVTEGENNVLIDNGTFCYYYKKAEPEKGIGCIVSFDTAYGFNIGTVIVEVKDAIAGCEYTEEAMNEENAFFMFGVEDGTVLRCTAEDNTIVFVFQDNALCATAIFAGNDW